MKMIKIAYPYFIAMVIGMAFVAYGIIAIIYAPQ